MTAIDLFCGCGGLSEGLRKVGFSVIAAIDSDYLAMEAYRANHPEVSLFHSDIRTIRPRSLMKSLNLRRGRLDLLAGCPPCQGFCPLRTLNGSRKTQDPRNDLIFEFLKFVEQFKPRAVMFENVPGLSKDKRFQIFCTRMRELDYIGEYRILNAAEYGVPQRRYRLIYLAGSGRAIPFARPCFTKRTVRDAIGWLPKAGHSGDPVHDIPEERSEKTLALVRRIPKNGGSRSDLPAEFILDCHKRCDGFRDVYGRMTWDDVSPTITGGCFNPSKGRFLHPEEDRAITMREAALLQSFPKRYKFPITAGKCAVAEMIGNALPPELVRRHAQLVKSSLEKRRC